MFEDSLIESGGKLKTKRGFTSIVSFAIQIMIVGVMVLIPLIFTEALPKGTTLFMLVAPPPPPPPPPPAAAPVRVVKVVQTDIINGELRTPTKKRKPHRRSWLRRVWWAASRAVFRAAPWVA